MSDAKSEPRIYKAFLAADDEPMATKLVVLASDYQALQSEIEKQADLIALREQTKSKLLDDIEYQKSELANLNEKLRVAVEALQNWIEFERRCVAKDGPYVGDEITGLIQAGEKALQKIEASDEQ